MVAALPREQVVPSLQRAIVGGHKEDRLDFLDEYSVLVALFASLLPFGIFAEFFPCLLGGLAAGERQKVDEPRALAVLVVLRRPEADQLRAVLLEKLAGVIAEPVVQVGKLSIVGVIRAQLE